MKNNHLLSELTHAHYREPVPLSPRSSKITVRRKRKGEKKESARRRKEGEEKKAMVVLLVFITATLVHFEITFSKIRLKVH